MTSLRDLIKNSKLAKRELIAATVRLPKEQLSFVDELAEHLSLSRQETMLKLLEEGINIAKTELNSNPSDEELNSQCSFHLLNTNKGNNDDDHEMMVKEGIAAAFYEPWKFNIDRIKKNDYVFLYENGVGIIAYGKASGSTDKKDHEGNKDECHYQKLNNFTILSKAISAHDVKKILNRNVVFLRTMSGMPDGQKILDAISTIK